MIIPVRDTYPKVSADRYIASLANFARRPQVLILPGRVDKIGRPSTLFFAADFHSLENFKFSRDPQYIAYSWHTNFPGVVLATRNSVKERVYVKTDRRVFSYS